MTLCKKETTRHQRGRVNYAWVNKGPCEEDVLVICGCYSGRFGGEGNLLGERNWILQFGEGCQDPSETLRGRCIITNKAQRKTVFVLVTPK